MPDIKKTKKVSLSRKGKLKESKISEEEAADNFREVISKKREQFLVDKQPEAMSPKDKRRMQMLWIVVALIMAVVIILWILNFKNNLSGNNSQSQDNGISEMWQDMKKNVDQFSQNINNLFSKIDQEKLNSANQEVKLENLSQDDLKKLTNDILKKLEQNQAATNTNVNINAGSVDSNINSNNNINAK